MTFWHQLGGYCCLNSRLSGIILPLVANWSTARTDPAELLDGFEAMAEDPDEKVLKKHFPDLAPLVYTNGEAYSQHQLAFGITTTH